MIFGPSSFSKRVGMKLASLTGCFDNRRFFLFHRFFNLRYPALDLFNWFRRSFNFLYNRLLQSFLFLTCLCTRFLNGLSFFLFLWFSWPDGSFDSCCQGQSYRGLSAMVPFWLLRFLQDCNFSSDRFRRSIISTGFFYRFSRFNFYRRRRGHNRRSFHFCFRLFSRYFNRWFFLFRQQVLRK